MKKNFKSPFVLSFNDEATDTANATPAIASTVAQPALPATHAKQFTVLKSQLIKGGRILAELQGVEDKTINKKLMLELADVQMLNAIGQPIPRTGSVVVAEESVNPTTSEVSRDWVKLVM